MNLIKILLSTVLTCSVAQASTENNKVTTRGAMVNQEQQTKIMCHQAQQTQFDSDDEDIEIQTAQSNKVIPKPIIKKKSGRGFFKKTLIVATLLAITSSGARVGYEMHKSHQLDKALNELPHKLKDCVINDCNHRNLPCYDTCIEKVLPFDNYILCTNDKAEGSSWYDTCGKRVRRSRLKAYYQDCKNYRKQKNDPKPGMECAFELIKHIKTAQPDAEGYLPYYDHPLDDKTVLDAFDNPIGRPIVKGIATIGFNFLFALANLFAPR
jgi:hypothetical protein